MDKKRKFLATMFLTTALTSAGLASCKNPTTNTPDNGPEKPIEKPDDPTIDPENPTIDPENPTIDPEKPAEKYPLVQDLGYIGVFERHRYANADESYDGMTRKQKLEIGQARVLQAAAYDDQKNAEFKALCANDPNAANFFDVDEITKNISTTGAIDDVLENRYDAYAKYMGRIDYELEKMDSNNFAYDNDDYQSLSLLFELCYQKLGVLYYTDSLGKKAEKHNSKSEKEETSMIDPKLKKYFGIENLTYEQAAEKIVELNGIVSSLPGMPQQETLNKAVEKALLLEGKTAALHDGIGHGIANAFGKDNSDYMYCIGSERSLKYFETKMTSYYDQYYQTLPRTISNKAQPDLER